MLKPANSLLTHQTLEQDLYNVLDCEITEVESRNLTLENHSFA